MSSLIMSMLMIIAAGVALLIGLAAAYVVLLIGLATGIGLIPAITAIVLIPLGLLAVSSSIIAQRCPSAQSYIDALLPYLGWLGCLCGMWVLFNEVRFLSPLMYKPNAWMLIGVLECVSGLLLAYLGYALLTKRGDEVRPYQTRLGYLAIVLGVWALFKTLGVFWVAHILGGD
jgi:hypothetical protein